MGLADRALSESLHGNTASALRLYQEAFQLEREAAIEARRLNLGEPTISVLHRSAATLALDAGKVREAERLVAAALSQDPPDNIAEELRDLLEQVTFRRHLSLRGVQLNPTEFQFAMTGSAVGFGIVSSDEFIDRVETVEKLVYRTAERKMQRPFREGGRRNKTLQNEVDLFVSVPRAASFAVTFRIGSSYQRSLLPEAEPLSVQLVDELLTCFELLEHGDEQGIQARIPETAYFLNFVNLATKVLPDGKDVTGVGFTAVGPTGQVREVALRRPRKQKARTEAVHVPSVPAEMPETKTTATVTVTGRLKMADELHQRNEIRIETGDDQVHRVIVPAGLMSDIVKPLWAERVTVSGSLQSDGTMLLMTIDRASE
jgi:hypothetical protein